VPAFAVIQKGLTLFVFIRCKSYVGCYLELFVYKVNLIFYNL